MPENGILTLLYSLETKFYKVKETKTLLKNAISFVKNCANLKRNAEKIPSFSCQRKRKGLEFG